MRRNIKRVVPVALSLLCACSAPEPLGIARPVAPICNETNLDDRFFGGVFSGTNDLDLAGVQGYSEFFTRFNEPSLSCAADVDEAYRLVYVPERGDVLTIRAERRENGYTVTVASGDSKTGNPQRRTHALTPQEWAKLTDAVISYNFWSRSPYPTQSTINGSVIVVHGPVWLLEGQRDRWYHAVSRESSFKEPEFDIPARTLFAIAGLEAPGVVRPRP